MDQGATENGSAASDGMPNVSPQSQQGSGRKAKQHKTPKPDRAAPPEGANRASLEPAASLAAPAAASPVKGEEISDHIEKPGAEPGSCKKPKAETKPKAQGPEQIEIQSKVSGPVPGQGQKKGQGQEAGQGQKKGQVQDAGQGQKKEPARGQKKGQEHVQHPGGAGQGQSEGAQGDTAPQRSKAELRAERRAKQEAQREAKTTKKVEGAGGDKQKQEAAKRVPTKVLQDDPNMEKKVEKKLAKQNLPARSSSDRKVALFNHLRQHDRSVNHNHLMNLQVWSNGGDSAGTQGIHPAVVRLGLNYLNYSIVGSDARAAGLLSAFDQAIADYEVPENKEFCRDIDVHLKRYISFLDECRPLSVSMGNAIKFVKWKISQLAEMPDMPEVEARAELRRGIKKFLKEKIESASDAAALYGSELFSNGDAIIVYGFSSVVFKVLRKLKEENNVFRVLVIDNRPKHEGKEMLHRLRTMGIDCAFVSLNMAAIYIRAMKNGSLVGQIQPRNWDLAPHARGPQSCKVLLGAHGVLNNACVMSRVGTAMLGAIAKAQNIPVLVCFATYKISDRSQCDSFVFNELGDPDELVASDRTDWLLPGNWRDWKSLCLLNLMYDVMPAASISTYVTEIRSIPATAIPKVMNSRVSLYET